MIKTILKAIGYLYLIMFVVSAGLYLFDELTKIFDRK